MDAAIDKVKNKARQVEISTTELVFPEEIDETCSFWFCLVPKNPCYFQSYDQLGGQHIRLRNKEITVSVIQKYLLQKLKLDEANEVIIECRGIKLSPYQSIMDIKDIWISGIQEDDEEAEAIWNVEDLIITLEYYGKEKQE